MRVNNKMKRADSYNPIVVTIYFIAIICISMFCMNPAILLISLVCALIYLIMRENGQLSKKYAYYILLFAIISIVNPIFSHRGDTILFILNDNPITLEALVYGAAMATAVLSTICWFSAYASIMTSDKLLYLTGRLSPKLSLIISIALRYISLFTVQVKKIKQSQMALGLFTEKNIIDKARGYVRIFSILITWALENGIVTAQSMEARGYGCGKRSNFTNFRFRRKDALVLFVVLMLWAMVIIGIAAGDMGYTFYPTCSIAGLSLWGTVGYTCYALLCMLFILLEVEDSIRWKYLESRI